MSDTYQFGIIKMFFFSALIGIFYVIFYAGLAALFVSMLAIFLNCIIESDRPRLTGMQSLLKLNPGKLYGEIFLLSNCCTKFIFTFIN